jgi:hypothetical protein
VGEWRIRVPPGGAGRVGRAWLLDHLIRPQQQCLGIVSPSALAVLGLMTSSNVVGSWIGRSLAVPREPEGLFEAGRAPPFAPILSA